MAFNSSTVWELGSTLRALASKEHPDQSACISITHANSTPLFVTHTTDAISPAYLSEMDAIRNTVKRWDISTWRRHRLLTLGEHSATDVSKSQEYSTKGGGWPIRVKGVVGIVAIVVVIGLYPVNGKSQSFNPLKYEPVKDTNHELIVKALEMILDKQYVFFPFAHDRDADARTRRSLTLAAAA
jgi:uncharacterized protein (UPF0303 family)